MQVWPAAAKMPDATPASAASKSASSKTILGDFPPSSSVTCLRSPAAALLIAFPAVSEPVKAILAMSGWLTRGGAHVLARAAHDVHDARRETRQLEELGECDGGSAGELGRLDDEGVAGGQARRQLPRQEQQRRVPCGDGGHHAQGFPSREDELVRLVYRQDGAFDLVRQPRVVVVPLGDGLQLDPHFAEQLAVVPDLDLGKPVRIFGDQISHSAQQRPAGGGGHLRPLGRMECGLGGGDGGVDIALVAVRHFAPVLVLVGVEAGHPTAGGRRRHSSSDEVFKSLHLLAPDSGSCVGRVARIHGRATRAGGRWFNPPKCPAP